jgi:flagellar basal body-associated protein FliL
MKLDKMGVLILMAHLVITLAVIAAYLITLWMGKPDEALKIAIPVIIGYWFGAMGANTFTKKSNPDNTSNQDKKGA